MIFYAKTKQGIDDFLSFFPGESDAVLWIRYGVVTEDECRAIRSQGTKVTQFTVPESLPEDEQETCNLYTIADHHPRLPVWVERAEPSV